MMQFTHLDAAESAFFERELERIKSQTFDIEYPNLMADRWIPVSREIDPGNSTWTYQQFDRHGVAKVVSDWATDFPNAEVEGVEFSQAIRTVGASYSWTVKEIRASQVAGKQLNARKASACRRMIAEKLDDIACFGDANNGIATGALNDPDVTDTNATNSGWPVSTQAERDAVVSDVSAAYQRILDNTLGLHRMNTLLLPTAQHAKLATTRYSDASDTTILNYMLQNFPGLMTIEPWYRLDTADVGTPRALAYELSSNNLFQELAVEFEELPPQERGASFLVHCMGTTGGAAVPYPKALEYIDDL
jgi:hypothetical protein